MKHPFAELLGIEMVSRSKGRSGCQIDVTPALFNPNGVLHGAVAYALADTTMGSACHSLLQPGQACATIEIKIHYFAAVRSGVLRCETVVINQGKRVVTLESSLHIDSRLVAKALGSFAVLKRRTR